MSSSCHSSAWTLLCTANEPPSAHSLNLYSHLLLTEMTNVTFYILKEPIPGCKGLWTVYHNKNSRSHNTDSSKMADDDDEYHAYLIISLETRTMVNLIHIVINILL